MEQALYRKYRSNDLDEVIGQDHIVSILNNSLSKNISHAYLFTGPRGVGKTSVARILARKINGLDKNDTNFYPDIVEIDAASNRRIEEVRALRDVVQITPTSLKYKVYIIDEVHMLTREAFNALLKTLEEPPEFVVFILATTELHKVPDTILSRCINLNFKLISDEDIFEHLTKISKKEKITIEPKAIKLIASQSEGSFRDAISILDQVSNISDNISLKDVEQLIGIANEEQIDLLIESTNSGDIPSIFATVDKIIEFGGVPDKIISQLSTKLRDILVSGNKENTTFYIGLLDNLNKISQYNDPKLGLEIALSKSVPEHLRPAIKEKKSIEQPKENELLKSEEPLPQAIDEPFVEIDETIGPVIETSSDDVWENALNIIKDKHNTLYGIARMGKPEYSGETIIIKFRFKFHLNQLGLDKNKLVISKVLKDLGYENFELKLEEAQEVKPIKPTIKKEAVDTEDNLTSISNIFGSAEVLES